MAALRDFIPPALYNAGARFFMNDYIKAGGVQSALATAVRALGLQGPQRTPRRFDQLAKEGYEANVIIFRAVHTLSWACASVPWLLYKKRGTSKRGDEIESHPLLDLLSNPNDDEGMASFLTRYFGFLIIAGNSYIHAMRPTSRVGAPVELEILRPDRMEIVPGADGRVAGYVYRVAGEKLELPKGDVLQSKTFAGTRDYYGLSPLEVAARSIDLSNQILDWSLALVQNGGRPPGFFVSDTRIPDTSFQRMEEELLDRFTGVQRAGLPGLLESGVKWLPSGLGPLEMDWQGLDKRTARNLAIAIGVPSELLGDSENKTYSNMQESHRMLYTGAAIPLLTFARDDFNRWLTPMFGPGLYLDFDVDSIPAMQEDRNQVYQRVRTAWWITVDEARDATGFDKLGPAKGGEAILVPGGMKPLEQVLAPPAPPPVPGGNPPAPGDPTGDNPPKPGDDGTDATDATDTTDATVDPLDNLLAGKAWELPRPKAGAGSQSHKAAQPANGATYSVPMQTGARQEAIDAAVATIRARFTAEAEAVRQALEGAEDTHGGDLEAPLSELAREQLRVQILRTLVGQRREWHSTLAALQQEALEQGMDSLISSLEAAAPDGLLGDFEYDPSDEAGTDLLDTLAAWSTTAAEGISDTNRSQLVQILDDTEHLATAGALLLAISSQYGDWGGSRASTIGGDAAVGAWHTGEDLAGVQLSIGITEGGHLEVSHTWETVGDDKVRDAHADADGQEQPAGQDFDVGGEALAFPGDPAGSIGNTINCRCGLSWSFTWVAADGTETDVAGDASGLEE